MMHYLSDVRLLGFTIFGFWAPIVFWSGYALLFGRGAWKDFVLMGIASLMLTFCISRDLPGFGPTFGLTDYAYLTVIPAYFLFKRTTATYLQIGGITYFTTLLSDVVGAPVAEGLHSGWMPLLLMTGPYNMQISFLHGIGGAGLLDGLCIAPLAAMLLIWLFRRSGVVEAAEAFGHKYSTHAGS